MVIKDDPIFELFAAHLYGIELTGGELRKMPRSTSKILLRMIRELKS